jgi:hypothetical protein
MSQSAIRYRDGAAYIKDEDLREFLKLLSFHLGDALHDQKDSFNWIAVAVTGWMNDHEELPPGLRDIELDEVLNEPNMKNVFTCYLDGLLKLPAGEGPYDKARAALVVERVLRDLKSSA